MGKLNVTLHPLFFIFGLYFALTGKVFSFTVITLSALLHELGHAFAAEKLGYKLNRITLMPYGAVIGGDISGIRYRDEIKVVAAGPMVSLAISVSILAVWWVFPTTYPYTELALNGNLALFAVNLLPAFPLDGGRLLLATLSLKLKRKTAVKIVKICGYIFSAALLVAFAYSAQTEINPSLLFFSLFMLFGTAEKTGENDYVKLYESFSGVNLKTKEIKTLAVNSSCTVKTLLKEMDGDYLYRLYVYEKDGRYKILEPMDVLKILESRGLYEKII